MRPKPGPEEMVPEGRRKLLQGSGATKSGPQSGAERTGGTVGIGVCWSLWEKTGLQEVNTRMREEGGGELGGVGRPFSVPSRRGPERGMRGKALGALS